MADALANGATATTGGAPVSGTEGYFFQPTVLTGVTDETRIVKEEQFGPALPIMPYKTDEEALQRANDSEYGLSGSVWSGDDDKAVEMANLAAWLGNKQGHHPDITFGYGYCDVTFTTHAAGGLTENDFICAARLDALVA